MSNKGFRAKLLIALAVPLSGITLPALAHGECDTRNEHGQVHQWMDGRHQQIHELLNDGLISQREHRRLDQRLGDQHTQYHYARDPYAYGNSYGYGYSNGYDPYNGGSAWGQAGNARPASGLKTLVRNYLFGF